MNLVKLKDLAKTWFIIAGAIYCKFNLNMDSDVATTMYHVSSILICLESDIQRSLLFLNDNAQRRSLLLHLNVELLQLIEA
jgi:hypothetical protein